MTTVAALKNLLSRQKIVERRFQNGGRDLKDWREPYRTSLYLSTLQKLFFRSGAK
jgi:hypothetical protein